jgi:hypothetical protein
MMVWQLRLTIDDRFLKNSCQPFVNHQRLIGPFKNFQMVINNLSTSDDGHQVCVTKLSIDQFNVTL